MKKAEARIYEQALVDMGHHNWLFEGEVTRREIPYVWYDKSTKSTRYTKRFETSSFQTQGGRRLKTVLARTPATSEAVHEAEALAGAIEMIEMKQVQWGVILGVGRAGVVSASVTGKGNFSVPGCELHLYVHVIRRKRGEWHAQLNTQHILTGAKGEPVRYNTRSVVFRGTYLECAAFLGLSLQQSLMQMDEISTVAGVCAEPPYTRCVEAEAGTS